MSSSGRQMSTRVIGGEGGAAAAPPPPSATRHSSSSISSSSSSSEQEPDNCHGEDAQEDDDDEEEEEEEEQQQQHNGHGGDGGFVPNPAKKQRQQYRATESAKKQQTTRDLRITSTLLHPEHSMAMGVWTSTGHVKSCSKGIGTDIKLRDQVVETLLAGIQNFTPSEKEISKLQHAEDAFFGGVLTRLKLCTLVRCLGYRTAAKVDPAVGSLVRVCVCT